jgi:acyl dehydratase
VETTFDVAAHSQSLVGHHYRAEDYYEVGREKIREYARAVQDMHPAHRNEESAAALGYTGLVAPITFVSIPAMVANRKLFESVIAGYEVYVQTDQVFEIYRPVVAGDRLVSDVELSSVRRVAGRDLLTVKNTFIDQTDHAVLVMYTTMVGITSEDVDAGIGDGIKRVIMYDVGVPGKPGTARSAVAEPDGNRTPRTEPPRSEVGSTRVPATTIRFGDLAVGDELPPRTVRLTRGDLVNYAGVAGDVNPIHWDESVAALAGLPNVIAHGMLTMALGAGFVTRWLGDPGALTRYAVRLSNYTIVDAQSAGSVEFTARVKSLDPATRTAVIVIVAKSAGRKIFGLATAEVRLGG